MVRPSSRGGVPVLSRPSANPSASSVRESPIAGASPTRPAGVLLLADMDEAAQERAGREHHRAGAELAPVRELERRRRGRRAIIRSSASASMTVRLAVSPDRLLHRRGVEPPVGLGPRPAHRRSLAAVEHAELDAAAIGDAAHQPIERVDLAHQMALAQAADRRIAGHRADGGKPVRHQRGRARPCGPAAAAASQPACPPPTTMTSNRASISQALRMRACSRGGGGVKEAGRRDVSRETFTGPFL